MYADKHGYTFRINGHWWFIADTKDFEQTIDLQVNLDSSRSFDVTTIGEFH